MVDFPCWPCLIFMSYYSTHCVVNHVLFGMKNLYDGVDDNHQVDPYKRAKEPEQPIFRPKEHALFYKEHKQVGLFIFFHNGQHLANGNK